ncbi:LysR family transcriptional regulator [Agaricicola taiwanensis]|uniref:LysR family transcriptional regulator n=1 Tax=Agaricicola taiwanensis TaxID=591372 RepID=A0A8J2VNH4_9RHOB|nr:LysR family transcriptional regulator [Agaricicola taiwanensis]
MNILTAIDETGSLSGAAKRLGLTQSAISQAMQAFEDSLGQRLFDRSLRPPAFTMTGRLILKHAGEIIERTQQLEHALRFSAQAQLPLLRLGVIDTFATTVIPHLINDLGDIASNWSVKSGAEETSISAVLEHRADLIITSDDPARHANLAVRFILREPYCLVLPKAAPDPGDDIGKLSEHLDFVHYSKSLHMREEVDRYLGDNGVRTKNKYQFSSIEAVMAMVAGGLGWSIATPLALLKARHHISSLQCLPLPNANMQRAICLVGHEGESDKVMDKIFKSTVGILKQNILPEVRALCPHLGGLIKVDKRV